MSEAFRNTYHLPVINTLPEMVVPKYALAKSIMDALGYGPQDGQRAVPAHYDVPASDLESRGKYEAAAAAWVMAGFSSLGDNYRARMFAAALVASKKHAWTRVRRVDLMKHRNHIRIVGSNGGGLPVWYEDEIYFDLNRARRRMVELYGELKQRRDTVVEECVDHQGGDVWYVHLIDGTGVSLKTRGPLYDLDSVDKARCDLLEEED